MGDATAKYNDFRARYGSHVPPAAQPRPREEVCLLNLIHEAVTVRSLETGLIMYWNSGATTLYGWLPDQVGDRPLDALLRTSYPRPVHEILAILVREGFWEGELEQCSRWRQAITVASRWALRQDERGTAIVQVDRDITEQKRIEASRESLQRARNEEVRRLGELAALKADFSAMVVHEYLGPLSAIARLTDMLATGKLDPAMQGEVIESMLAEVALLNALATDMREAATAERVDFAVQLQSAPLADLLEQATLHARALPTAGPITVTHAAPVATRVVADSARVLQVLRNLLGNAVKYSPPGSPVEIRATLEEDGSRARIVVADHGYGIRPEDIPRILQKFGRGRDAQHHHVHGVGLGLYLSRRIIQAHGSDLAVESTPAIGSAFSFALQVQ